MQALILAGGEGTRLRPLTTNVPKPVIPLVERPFASYMLDWLRSHGVDDVIMASGFLADRLRDVLGDGAEFGVRLRFVEEPEPLGTAGALRFAAELLEDRFLMLNGDVLTDIDLTAQLEQHERTGARATLGLIPVDDPSAFGLVRRNPDDSVSEFVEKPSPDQIDTDLINAGVYVLERSVLEAVPPRGTNSSIEREVFPVLVGQGLFGYAASGYWLDIGTPRGYLQATFDILEGAISTKIGDELKAAGLALVDGARVDGKIVPPVLVGPGCDVGERAIVGGRAVLGRGVRIGAESHVESSVVLEGASVGARTTVSSSIVGPGASIGDHCHIEGGVVLGEGVKIGPGNIIAAGARIFPGVELPEGAIKF
jgi:mannose-1-phosphate guanylyltransferase